MSRRHIPAALVQMQMGDDLEANLVAAEKAIMQAEAAGARLICLPELFRAPYLCQVEDADLFDLAEPIPGPTTERFATLAAHLDVVLVLSLFEKRAPGLYHNTAVVLDGKQGIVGQYRKMHIPDDPKFYEKFYFTPGDTSPEDSGFGVVETSAGNLGVLVCWDQWYPEAARLTALAGADVLIYPTAIGWHPEERESHGDAQYDAWRTIQRSHAVANGLYVLAINRTGFEPTPGGAEGEGLQFWGRSFATAPDGRVIAEASHDEAEVVLAGLDLGLIEEQRRGWPFLRDRRIDAYGGLLRRWGR